MSAITAEPAPGAPGIAGVPRFQELEITQPLVRLRRRGASLMPHQCRSRMLVPARWLRCAEDRTRPGGMDMHS